MQSGILVNNQPITSPQLPSDNLLLSFPSTTEVSVFSPAYINIGLQQLDIKLYLLDGNERLNDFTGNATIKDRDFPPRQTTNFTLVS